MNLRKNLKNFCIYPADLPWELATLDDARTVSTKMRVDHNLNVLVSSDTGRPDRVILDICELADAYRKCLLELLQEKLKSVEEQQGHRQNAAWQSAAQGLIDCEQDLKDAKISVDKAALDLARLEAAGIMYDQVAWGKRK